MEVEYSEVDAQQEVSQQHTTKIERLARKQEVLEDKMKTSSAKRRNTIVI